jgi:NTP pyrophosphatase (non-canonical NTP hydrolase)
MENQKSIAKWAFDTFGHSTNARAAARANKEMAELLTALTSNDAHPKAAEEVADVVICMVRIADNMSFDIWEEIEKKMAINRSREWELDGTGCGQHVEQKENK